MSDQTHDVSTLGQTTPVSRPLANPEPMATALRRWTTAMYQPQTERASAAKRARAEKRATAPVVPLSLNALMDRMDWSQEYAEHLVQPYCDCDIDREGGWDYCEHARDLGLTP